MSITNVGGRVVYKADKPCTVCGMKMPASWPPAFCIGALNEIGDPDPDSRHGPTFGARHGDRERFKRIVAKEEC